jgi:hypothetical protein
MLTVLFYIAGIPVLLIVIGAVWLRLLACLVGGVFRHSGLP